MLSCSELQKEIIISVAEQYVIFNSKNEKSKDLFVEFYISTYLNFSKKNNVPCLPKFIGSYNRPYKKMKQKIVFNLITSSVNKMGEFIKDGFTLNKFDCLNYI